MTDDRTPEKMKKLFADALVILADAEFPADRIASIEYEETIGEVSMSIEIFASLVLATGIAVQLAKDAEELEALAIIVIGE